MVRCSGRLRENYGGRRGMEGGQRKDGNSGGEEEEA